MIHRLRWRVGSDEALAFWAERLAREGVEFDRDAGDWHSLAFRDSEGLGLEIAVAETSDEPLVAAAEGIAAEHALQGFDGVRSYSRPADLEEPTLTKVMGFHVTAPGSYILRGGRRHASYVQDNAPFSVSDEVTLTAGSA
jgi:glyoxalase family protein